MRTTMREYEFDWSEALDYLHENARDGGVDPREVELTRSRVKNAVRRLEDERDNLKEQIHTMKSNNCYELRSRIGSALGVCAGDSIRTGDLIELINILQVRAGVEKKDD